jgi:putative ABC transport system permease protein
MKGVALKGLARRKTRAVLTALAIVLGVAMVSGTYALEITVVPLVAFVAVAVVASVLAAVMPARRAARLNVLRALQYE